jgi:hypothetical protein
VANVPRYVREKIRQHRLYRWRMVRDPDGSFDAMAKDAAFIPAQAAGSQ